MRVGLVTCSKEKVNFRTEAYNLYSASPDFRLNIAYAIENYDDVFIASGKFGLLELETVLDPYDVWIGLWDQNDQNLWGIDMVRRLRAKGYDTDCEFVLHVDDMYYAAIKFGFDYFGYKHVTHVHYQVHLNG